MNRFDNKPLITGALVLGALLAQSPVEAEAASSPLSKFRGARIVGVWDVNVDVLNCATGATLFSFPAMHKFELGGTGQVVPASGPTAQPHVMVWDYLGKNTWSSVFKFYRFDGTGKVIGTTVLTNEVSLSQDGTEYSGDGVAELYDLDGNLVGAQGCPSFTGTRFESAP